MTYFVDTDVVVTASFTPAGATDPVDATVSFKAKRVGAADATIQTWTSPDAAIEHDAVAHTYALTFQPNAAGHWQVLCIATGTVNAKVVAEFDVSDDL